MPAFELCFKLQEKFVDQYKDKQPKFGPIGLITYKRTYAREIAPGITEEFWQTLRRVVEGTYSIQKCHCKSLGLPWSDGKAQRSAQEMYKLMWDFKFLPAGRGLQMMGTEYVMKRGSACLLNCGFVSTKDINLEFSTPFCFLMDMSMLGVGVGGDTRGAGKITIKEPKQGDYTFTVEDTREGWVELLRVVLDSYVGKDVLPGKIDYSKVRPYGAKITGFGGIASGPEPLKELVEVNIAKVLQPLIGELITSTAIVDLFNYIGKCVVSGNVRRTAEIMLGQPNDLEFLSLKDPAKYAVELKSHRWTSNNSVFAEIGMDYAPLAKIIQRNGEPGFIWIESIRRHGRMIDPEGDWDEGACGVNPCSEQALEDREACNLVETFPANCKDFEEFKRALKFAYLYAKTVTLLPTHNERTNAVMLRNRRIGTSQSGIAQNIKKIGRREHFEWCDKGYQYLRALDRLYSKWLCIPMSIKITSVKPSGSISLLPGATPGIHYPESQFYIRRVRLQENSFLVEPLRKAGYKVEPEITNTRAVVVEIPVEEEYFDRSIHDISMWEQLENTAQMQTYWADNQISVTIRFSKEEAKDLARALEIYERRLKTVTFFPQDDHGFEQAPYEPITAEQYKSLKANIKPIIITNSEANETGHLYCDSDRCEIVPNA